jgi:AraC family transcriptional regulator, transcriptional activator of pobA
MVGRSIPQYFLYGETTQDVDERFLHVESIAERSRRHNWTIRPHAHRDLYHLLFVMKGGGVFDCEGAHQSFGSNTLIGVPQSCVHGFEFKTSTDGWIVTASGALLARITREHAELASVFEESYVLSVDPPALSATQALFSSLVFEFRCNLPLRRAAAESWLTTIAIATLRRRVELAPVTQMKGADSVLASRYRLLVEANFRSSWGVADYAAKLCISSERLRVACVQTTASSPLALLNARRLLEAKRSLLYTNMNVALVAEACGFADPAYFSRFFARSTGKSPRAYRLGTRESFRR